MLSIICHFYCCISFIYHCLWLAYPYLFVCLCVCCVCDGRITITCVLYRSRW